MAIVTTAGGSLLAASRGFSGSSARTPSAAAPAALGRVRAQDGPARDGGHAPMAAPLGRPGGDGRNASVASPREHRDGDGEEGLNLSERAHTHTQGGPARAREQGGAALQCDADDLEC